MANQNRTAGADLWFVTADGTPKLRDLEADPHINLSYYNDGTREWISVSGLAAISRDRQNLVSGRRGPPRWHSRRSADGRLSG